MGSGRSLQRARAHRDQHGFTLIELVVVIIILGVIAAIAVPVYDNVIGNSKSSTLTATAQAFDRDFLATAAFDTASSSSRDPRVSSDSNGSTLPNSGFNALNAAGNEDRLAQNGYWVCANNSATTVRVSLCTSPGDAVGSWTGAGGNTDTPDYYSVVFVKQGKYACLTLGSAESTPGVVTTGDWPGGAADKC